MYAKLINGQLEYAPNNIVKNNIAYSNYNCESNDTMLREDGYKPVIVNETSEGMKSPEIRYSDNGSTISIYYIETYQEPNYFEKRAVSYPDFREYLDAQVKINSGNEKLIAEGKIQLQNYYQKCLEIKNTYPKA